jgi:putative ABC transport system permease protein
MWRTTLKGLAAHKLRFALTALSVVLGVAFMAATLIVTDTTRVAFTSLFTDVGDEVDVVVRPEPAFEGAPPEPLPAALLAAVRDVEGVAAAEGSVSGVAQYLDAEGNPVGSPQAPQLGFNWPGLAEVNPWELTEGRAPEAADELVMDRGTAREQGFAVGDTVQVVASGAPESFEVVGIAGFGEVDSPLGASVALFTEERAQELLGSEGTYSDIAVVAAEGVAQEDLAERVDAALPDGSEVLTGQAAIAADQEDVTAGLGGFTTFLLAFAVIALFVGSFVIYNTFSIVVAQRTREMALLRALGAGRRAVLTSVLVEAFVVSLLASALGLVAGVGLSLAMRALLGSIGLELPDAGTVVAPRTILVSLAVGVVVTVLAAFLPARRASRVPPIAALRDVAVDSSCRSTLRAVLGTLVTALGAGLLVLGLFGDIEQPLPLLGAGALAVFLGIAILGPVIARPASALIGAPLPAIKGMTGLLAKENARRNPKRTASTASALMIGVALVAFITIFAASALKTVYGDIDRTFQADLLVRDASFNGLDPELAGQLRALPGVEAVSSSRGDMMLLDGEPQFVSAYDMGAIDRVLDLGVTGGALGDLTDGGLAVSTQVAEDKGWAVGDTVPVTFAATGEQELTVDAIFDNDAFSGSYLLDVATFDDNFTEVVGFQELVAAREGVEVEQLRSQVQEVLDASAPSAEIQTVAEVREEVAGGVGQALNFVYALLALAVIIALIGIANTLALSVFERTRELGLLRAVGMSRRQLRSAVRWESVLIALLGTALGLGVGVFFAWVLSRGLRDEGFTEFVIPGGQLALQVLIAAVAGVLAAIGPARRAARLDVLKAIATE